MSGNDDETEQRAAQRGSATTESETIPASTRRVTLTMPTPQLAPRSVAATMIAATQRLPARSITSTFPIAVVRDVARGERPEAQLVAGSAPVVNDADASTELPPLPTCDAPTGFVWPVMTGHDLLRAVALHDARRRNDLLEERAQARGTRSGAILAVAGTHLLETSLRHRFHDFEAARAALVKLARNKAQLGALLPTDTVIAIRAAADGSFWMWTVTPLPTTLHTLMSKAAQRGDARALGTALAWFAWAAAAAAALTRAKQLVIDMNPVSFAVERDHVSYIANEIEEGTQLAAIGPALLQRFDEHADVPAALEAYASAIEAAFVGTLTRADATAIGLEASFRAGAPRSEHGRAAKERLLRIVHALR